MVVYWLLTGDISLFIERLSQTTSIPGIAARETANHLGDLIGAVRGICACTDDRNDQNVVIEFGQLMNARQPLLSFWGQAA